MASGKTEVKHGARERLDDVAEEERFLFIGRRRRPSGDAQPHPFRLRRSGWLWLGLGVAVVGIWVWLFATGRPVPVIEPVDEAVLNELLRVSFFLWRVDKRPRRAHDYHGIPVTTER